MTDKAIVLELKEVGLTYRKRKLFFRHAGYSALRDISFEVFKGETFGIVGRNGAGKSTLLRVLADIYKPDAGEVIRHCRHVLLLSLTAGFDSELSGRDNAVIGGMLLGVSKQQILSKLDEIIQFSGLGESIDNPIKTYSSGMRARLGFSIGITIDADLLLIDEVLSVGDAGFRKKAEAAMAARVNSEQTVILVSHSAAQIRKLCDRVAWIEDGCLRAVGETAILMDQFEDYCNRRNPSIK
ncbi:MAG: ATP-binding cassette domain-containing protein [Pseudomonadota bacterium]